MKKYIYCIASLLACFSCENGDVEHGDYDYQTVYFSRQTPIRTIVLGDDVFDRTLDNNHQFEVYVTLGGVEQNKQDRQIGIAVDPTLCSNMKYSTGGDVSPLPDGYYTLSSNSITIASGDIWGAVRVSLTDDFFNDPKALSLNYVLPLRITSSNDQVLTGKDYTLYGLKYINKYDGAWLSHGTDVIDLNGETTTVVREAEYVEQYDIRYLSTLGLHQVSYPLSTTVEVVDANGKKSIETLACRLILTFDGQDACNITTDTEECEAEGSGTWERGGARQAWGGKDRDLLKLNYTVTYHYQTNGTTAYKKYTSTDELIMRDRQANKLEDFTIQSK